MRPPALAGDEILEAVTIDVHAVHRVRFGKHVLEEVMSKEGGIGTVAGPLLMPPDTKLVSGTADDVRLAVAVQVISEHIGACLAEVGGMKFPGLFGR